jgi:hypothetical protein
MAGQSDRSGKQRAWLMHVLTAVLVYPQDQITEGQTLPVGLEASMPEMGETLRPDFAFAERNSGRCRPVLRTHRASASGSEHTNG